MISNAKKLLSETVTNNSDSVGFFVGDAKDLNKQELLFDNYDIVITEIGGTVGTNIQINGDITLFGEVFGTTSDTFITKTGIVYSFN